MHTDAGMNFRSCAQRLLDIIKTHTLTHTRTHAHMHTMHRLCCRHQTHGMDFKYTSEQQNQFYYSTILSVEFEVNTPKSSRQLIE